MPIENCGKRLQATIGWTLNKEPATLGAFVRELEKENINAVLRKGKDGVIYGITYVDHKSKAVFNGSDLGKEYSAKAILAKCRQGNELKLENPDNKQVKNMQIELHKDNIIDTRQQYKQQPASLPQSFTPPPHINNYMPHQLVKKKKRKKKRFLFNHLKNYSMQTSENEQRLRKILDMTRLISIANLALHFFISFALYSRLYI